MYKNRSKSYPVICCISYSNKTGGTENYINNIINNTNLNIDWYFFESNKNFYFNENAQNCLGGIPKNKILRMYFFLKITYKLCTNNYKKIITFGFYPSFIGFLIKLIKPNIFWTITQREEYQWAKKPHLLFIYIFQIFSNRIETNAYHIKRSLIKKSLLKNKTHYSPNLIWDLSNKNNRLLLDKKIIDNKGKKILFIANNRPLKSSDLAIEVFKRISKKDKTIKFIIIGRGYENVKKEIKKERLISSNFLFTGELDNIDVRNYMIKGDLLLFLSKTEAAPNTLIESIYNGLPIIARRIPALETLIGKDFNGIFLSDLNSKNISEYILKLIYSKNKINLLRKRMDSSIISNKEIFSGHTFCEFEIRSGFYIKEFFK